MKTRMRTRSSDSAASTAREAPHTSWLVRSAFTDTACQAQMRASLAREDEGQRHRAVEQVGAPLLAGALRRARDVEDVIEQLEGEADAPPEDAELIGGAAALQRPEPARGLEQARRLELAAAQVAL